MAGAYEYEPLSTERSIRVAEILPSRRFKAPVTCRLHEASLDLASPRYTPFEALSYVWGSSVGDIPITYDGKVSLVTRNCHVALRRLRTGSSKRRLWIDAICINQSDVTERNQQVSVMGSIYGIASQTVVWLGEGEPVGTLTYHTDNAITLLRDWGSSISGYSIDCAWSLIWLGPGDIGYQSPKGITLNYNETGKREFGHCKRQHGFHDRLRSDMAQSKRDTVAAYQDLRHLATLRARDVRDHVVGAYSVMKGFGIELPAPDYSKTAEDLFIETTRKALNDCSSMRLLCINRPSKITQYMLPSWVIDWSTDHGGTEKPPIHTSTIMNERFRAAPGTFTMQDTTLHSHQLLLSGITIGCIKSLGDISKDNITVQGEASHHAMFADWAHQVLGEKRRNKGITVHPDVLKPLDPYMAFYNLLDDDHLPGRELFTRRPEIGSYMDWQIPRYATWLREIGISLDLDEIDWSDWPSEWQIKENTARHLEKGTATGGTAKSSFASGRSLTGLNFFVLERGYFGLGYRDVAEGDTLAIVAGADVPIILRPAGDFYTFMGSAFVPGIMYGEAWNDDPDKLEKFIVI